MEGADFVAKKSERYREISKNLVSVFINWNVYQYSKLRVCPIIISVYYWFSIFHFFRNNILLLEVSKMQRKTSISVEYRYGCS